MKNKVKEAITVLTQGGILIYPTDTAFGIGCRIDNHAAVDRLFQLRRRPLTQAMPVLVASQAMALRYLTPPSDIVRRLMNQYWPGALTIVTRCRKELIYAPIRGGGDALGVRMPNHQTVLGLIGAVGVPILGPSANFHGDPTPYHEEELNPQLVKLVDLVIDGNCPVGKVSTVIDCCTSPGRILRQGAVEVDIMAL